MTRSPRLWFATFGGMAAYAAHLLGNYWLAPAACTLRSTLPLHAYTLVLALVAAAATTAAVALYRAHDTAADRDAEPPGADIRGERVRFMAALGALLGPLSVALIVFGGTANVFFDPCRGTV